MRRDTIGLLAALLLMPALAAAQARPVAERGVYLTMFRSPATGLELRAGRAAVHAGHYPTILTRDGVRGNVDFVRAGVTYYARPSGATPYVSPSLVVSLDRGWRGGALTEAGVRGRLYRRLNGRLGAAVLTTTDGLVRVNPTVGFDLKLGGGR
jgi:hypothetical protein